MAKKKDLPFGGHPHASKVTQEDIKRGFKNKMLNRHTVAFTWLTNKQQKSALSFVEKLGFLARKTIVRKLMNLPLSGAGMRGKRVTGIPTRYPDFTISASAPTLRI